MSASSAGNASGAHVEAHPDHDRARAVGLGEDARELAVVDHDVVRPLQPGASTPATCAHGASSARATAAASVTRCTRSAGSAGRSSTETSSAAPGRRDPRAAEPAPARGLLVGDRHHTFRRARSAAHRSR